MNRTARGVFTKKVKFEQIPEGSKGIIIIRYLMEKDLAEQMSTKALKWEHACVQYGLRKMS